MRERDRGLSEASRRILERFTPEGLHEAFLFYSAKTDTFVAHLFYLTNDLVKQADESGLSSRLRHAVLEELEAVGRGERATLNVAFEFDSDETVRRRFGGNYFLRLR